MTTDALEVGFTVLVRGRPDYRAVIEAENWHKFTVRPCSGQGMSTRARAVWGKAIIQVIEDEKPLAPGRDGC